VRLVHVSDLHLGFQAFTRQTPEGRNVREVDVSQAFAAFVDRAIALKPDIVLVAGDVFHRRKPSPAAIADAVREFLRLMQGLPGVPVVAVCGNHEEPRDAGAGCILETLALIGVIVVLDAQRLHFPGLDAHVLCVADSAIQSVPLSPGPESGTHLLLAHGTIGGRLANIPGIDVLPASAISPDFAYAALGDIHSVEQIAPNAWYSGAIDRTSNDPWREIGEEKGFLEVDTVTGVVQHHALPTRRYIDLPEVVAHGLTAREVTDAILANLGGVDVTEAVVRQVVRECPTLTRQALDHRAFRSATAGALHFKVDGRKPEALQVGRFVAVGATLDDEPQPGDPDYYEPDVAEEPEPITAEQLADLERRAKSGGFDFTGTEGLQALESSIDEVAVRQAVRVTIDEADEVAMWEATRVRTRTPLRVWRELLRKHDWSDAAIARYVPDDSPHEVEFEASWAERERIALEMATKKPEPLRRKDAAAA
jgi:exonuclease SbcD